MNKRNKFRSKNQIFHFKNRFMQRFGVEIYNDDVFEIINLIKKDRVLYSKRITNTLTKHRLVYKNIDMIVLYSKKRSVPVTALIPRKQSKGI